MKHILVSSLLILGTTCAQAATVLITPTSVACTTTPNQEENGISGSLNDETRIIDGSGLSGSPTLANFASLTHASVALSGAGSANAWATVDIGAAGGDFFAQGGIAPAFVLSLGGTFSVTDFVIWGYHFGANNGNHPSAVSLEFSTNGGASYGAPVALTIPNAGAFNQADTVNFAAQTADTVRLTVTDNFFGGPAGGDRVGIAEVRFLGDAVPEPGAASLGLLGLAALLRRRRA